MSGARWTIRVCSGCQTDASQDCRCAPGSGSVDVPVEVMPVAEHERLREAAQAVVDAGTDHGFYGNEEEQEAACAALDALRAALDNTEEAS